MRPARCSPCLIGCTRTFEFLLRLGVVQHVIHHGRRRLFPVFRQMVREQQHQQLARFLLGGRPGILALTVHVQLHVGVMFDGQAQKGRGNDVLRAILTTTTTTATATPILPIQNERFRQFHGRPGTPFESVRIVTGGRAAGLEESVQAHEGLVVRIQVLRGGGAAQQQQRNVVVVEFRLFLCFDR